jgi:hypothetical protein
LLKSEISDVKSEICHPKSLVPPHPAVLAWRRSRGGASTADTNLNTSDHDRRSRPNMTDLAHGVRDRCRPQTALMRPVPQSRGQLADPAKPT